MFTIKQKKNSEFNISDTVKDQENSDQKKKSLKRYKSIEASLTVIYIFRFSQQSEKNSLFSFLIHKKSQRRIRIC